MISFNACISACEKGRQWEHALALLQEIALKQLSPTQISCLIQSEDTVLSSSDTKGPTIGLGPLGEFLTPDIGQGRSRDRGTKP